MEKSQFRYCAPADGHYTILEELRKIDTLKARKPGDASLISVVLTQREIMGQRLKEGSGTGEVLHVHGAGRGLPRGHRDL